MVAPFLGAMAATVVGCLTFGLLTAGAGFPSGLLLMPVALLWALPLNLFVLPVACLMTIGTSCRPRVIYLVGAVGGFLTPLLILLVWTRWNDVFGPKPIGLLLAVSGTAAGLASAACFVPVLRRQRRELANEPANGAP